MTIELLNCDCMDYMRGLPDKAFDLAIVDPPYLGFDFVGMELDKVYYEAALERFNKHIAQACLFGTVHQDVLL